MKSFYYDILEQDFNTDKLKKKSGKQRLEWLPDLKLSYKYDDFLCVHADLMPHSRFNMQIEKDMMWIRHRFLDSHYDFGLGIIHGHTPESAPVVKSNRIGIDTGAGMGGDLTALVVDQPWRDLVATLVF